jgi:hypothetical protein
LLTIFFFSIQRKCGSSEEYLSFCDAFIEELTKTVCHEDYRSYLYDEQVGEDERPYTTAYFAILVEEGSQPLPNQSMD